MAPLRRNDISKLILVGLILLAAPYALAAETFPAHVVGVVDGDTLRVIRRESGTIKVRLFGIDCPEKGQRRRVPLARDVCPNCALAQKNRPNGGKKLWRTRRFWLRIKLSDQ